MRPWRIAAPGSGFTKDSRDLMIGDRENFLVHWTQTRAPNYSYGSTLGLLNLFGYNMPPFLCLSFNIRLLHKNFLRNWSEILNYLECILNNADSWALPSEILIQLVCVVAQESVLQVILMLVEAGASTRNNDLQSGKLPVFAKYLPQCYLSPPLGSL